MHTTENQRLGIIMKDLRLNQVAFATSLGITQGALSDILREKVAKNGKIVKVSAPIKFKLEILYNVNLNWIETGEGEMYREPKTVNESAAEYQKSQKEDILLKKIFEYESVLREHEKSLGEIKENHAKEIGELKSELYKLMGEMGVKISKKQNSVKP